jgi:hypothetical protein
MTSIPHVDVIDRVVLNNRYWDVERWKDYKLVALYKTFSGEEFVEASLQSIYRFCHKIVMVHSNVSWSGEVGNTVAPVVREWASKNDIEHKIIHIEGDWANQEDQYQVGWNFINDNIRDADLVMLIDTDEVWDSDQLHRAVSNVFVDRENVAWTVELETYIKSIFYKIHPPEWCRPTVFVLPDQRIRGARGAGITPKDFLSHIHLHHFTYVRSTEEQVMKKIKTSFIGDGPRTFCVPLDDWIENKWNKLPFATNFHTTKGCEESWKSVKTVYMPDLPNSVFYNNKLISSYLPVSLMEGTDEALLFKYAEGKDIVVELGTFLGRGSVILSLRAKRVITIDLYENIVDHQEGKSFYINYPTEFTYSYQKVKDSLWMYSNIELIQGETVTEANKFTEKTDLLFIDADHSREGVKRDYNAWFPKVRLNGIIMFHDYGKIWPGIKEFVDTIGDELEFIEQVSTMRVYRKVKER